MQDVTACASSCCQARRQYMGTVKAAQRPVDGSCEAGYRKKWLMKGLSRVSGN